MGSLADTLSGDINELYLRAQHAATQHTVATQDGRLQHGVTVVRSTTLSGDVQLYFRPPPPPLR